MDDSMRVREAAALALLDYLPEEAPMVMR